MFVNNSKSERGQVGIGTLIVFIAMVLVAAIAAGVLINTAGMLQSQAEATGEESTDLVSERINVESAVGEVSSNGEEFDEIRLNVAPAAGSNDIDMSETIVQAVGPAGQANLVYEDGFETNEDDPVLSSDNGDIVLTFDPNEEPFGSVEDDTEVTEVSGTIDVSDDDLNEDIHVGYAGQTLTTSDGEFTFSNVEVNDENSNLVAFAEGYEPIAVPINPDTGVSDGVIDDQTDLELQSVDYEDTTESGNTVTFDVDGDVDSLNANFAGISGDYDPDADEITFENVADDADSTIGVIADDREPHHADETFSGGSWSTGPANVDLQNEIEGPEVDAFGAGDEATLDIVSPSGATTTVELRAPDLLSGGEAVRL